MLIDIFAEIFAALNQRGLCYTKTDFVHHWLDRRAPSYMQSMTIGRKNCSLGTAWTLEQNLSARDQYDLAAYLRAAMHEEASRRRAHRQPKVIVAGSRRQLC
jgi:hypothetical protein